MKGPVQTIIAVNLWLDSIHFYLRKAAEKEKEVEKIVINYLLQFLLPRQTSFYLQDTQKNKNFSCKQPSTAIWFQKK